MASFLRLKENYRRLQRYVSFAGIDGKQSNEAQTLAEDHGLFEPHFRIRKRRFLSKEYSGGSVATA